jgi:hypothetical protein
LSLAAKGVTAGGDQVDVTTERAKVYKGVGYAFIDSTLLLTAITFRRKMLMDKQIKTKTWGCITLTIIPISRPF